MSEMIKCPRCDCKKEELAVCQICWDSLDYKVSNLEGEIREIEKDRERLLKEQEVDREIIHSLIVASYKKGELNDNIQ